MYSALCNLTLTSIYDAFLKICNILCLYESMQQNHTMIPKGIFHNWHRHIYFIKVQAKAKPYSQAMQIYSQAESCS